MKSRWWIEAAGVSLLLILPYFFPLILPDHLAVYHHYLSLNSLIGGLLLDLLMLLLAGVGLLALLHRLPQRAKELAGACLAGILIWRMASFAIGQVTPSVLDRTNDLSDLAAQSRILGMDAFLAHHIQHILLIFLALCIVLTFIYRPGARFVVRAVRLAVAALGFSLLWIIPSLLYLSWGLHPTMAFDRSRSVPTPRVEKRVVWILMDELSYNLVFDHAVAGETFPNLWQLRAQSISLRNIEPAGLRTERIVPSLLLGRQINRIRSTANGDLLVPDPTHTHWVHYDPADTLFGLAQTTGWNPGVAGWYNPYCRIFESVLTACSWRPGIHVLTPFEQIGASANHSTFVNALVIPRHYAGRLMAPGTGSTSPALLRHDIRDYQTVMQNAQELIGNGRVGFVFIHLPVPHPPGIYNRKTHQICACGNYLDNLVLADDSLGALMHAIQATPWAGETTVIVSSDHSWRVPLWKQSPDWTAEEQQVSQGRFDARPVFLVHFPGQTTGQEIHALEPELVEHDAVAALLKQRVQDADSLVHFLQAKQN